MSVTSQIVNAQRLFKVGLQPGDSARDAVGMAVGTGCLGQPFSLFAAQQSIDKLLQCQWRQGCRVMGTVQQAHQANRCIQHALVDATEVEAPTCCCARWGH